MITGYKDMKAGDTITYTRPAMTKTIVVGDAFRSTGNVYAYGYGLTDVPAFNAEEDVHVELVRPPFVVGQPLTVEMGEPPIGSTVTFLSKFKQSYQDTWIRTATGWRDGDGRHIDWVYFEAGITGGQIILDRLGTGK